MKPRLLFDVTGLVHWYSFFRHPSGIQRVIEKLLPLLAADGDLRTEFVLRPLGSGDFHKVPADLLIGLCDPARRPQAIARLRLLFSASMRLAPLGKALAEAGYFHVPYALAAILRLDTLGEAWMSGHRRGSTSALKPASLPGPGDTIFNPGDLFWQKDHGRFLADLKRSTGVQLVKVLHDLFPFDHPEWSQPDLVRRFTSQFDAIAPQVDRWLSVSRFAAGQLERYCAARGLVPPTVSRLPLGWDSFAVESDPECPDDAIRGRHGLATSDYILFVGTLEPRKNLATLLDALDTLRRDLEATVPHLVIVGGYDWKSAALKQRIARSPSVTWLRRIPDSELPAIYRGSRFTVVPSLAEGWGLPVQESIAQGVPCIASSGGALRESGHGLAIHFDPAKPEELTALLKTWITTPGLVEWQRETIRRARRAEHFPIWREAAAIIKAAARDQVSPLP